MTCKCVWNTQNMWWEIFVWSIFLHTYKFSNSSFWFKVNLLTLLAKYFCFFVSGHIHKKLTQSLTMYIKTGVIRDWVNPHQSVHKNNILVGVDAKNIVTNINMKKGNHEITLEMVKLNKVLGIFESVFKNSNVAMLVLFRNSILLRLVFRGCETMILYVF